MDKVLHFVAGAALALIAIVGSYSISNELGMPTNKFVITGAGTAIGVTAGIVKEVYDSMGYGTAEFADIVASSIGAVSIATICLLILP